MWYDNAHNNYSGKISVRFALTKKHPIPRPYLVFRELYEEKWPRYIDGALYLIIKYHRHAMPDAWLYTIPTTIHSAT